MDRLFVFAMAAAQVDILGWTDLYIHLSQSVINLTFILLQYEWLMVKVQPSFHYILCSFLLSFRCSQNNQSSNISRLACFILTSQICGVKCHQYVHIVIMIILEAQSRIRPFQYPTKLPNQNALAVLHILYGFLYDLP